MNRHWQVSVFLFAAISALAACDAKGPLPSPDAIPPTVSFTIPANGSSNVPVNLSGITITFSEAMDLETITETTISVENSGGSGTVPCALTITDLAGTTVDLIPSVNLNPTTLYRIVVDAGVKDKFGNAMGAPFIASFYTGAVADTIPPVIADNYPATGATGVPANSSPRVTFSEPVIPQTIAFVLALGTTTIPGTVSYSGTTAVFAPSDILAANALYTARVAGGENGVRDLAGNPMPVDYTWTFKTAQDTTPPTVTATTPAGGGGNVGVNAAISVTFSEPVEQASIAFTLSAGGPPVAGSLTYSGTTAIFLPSNILAYGTRYTATVSSGLRDLAGNTMPGDYSWSFTTDTIADTTPPNVTATTPAGGEVNVVPYGALSATFSEPVDQASILFTLTYKKSTIPCSTTYSGMTAIFTPQNVLAYGAEYTATVSAGVQDLAGNAMPGDHSWSFTTGMAPDTTTPTVTATTPAAGEGTVGVNVAIGFTFSEPVDQTTILFDLSAGEVHATGTLAYSDTTATFTPSGPLNYSTLYTGTVSAGVEDLAGNAMPSDHSWSFTTGVAPDTTPPTVTATTPAAGEGTVGVNVAIGFTFSEPVDQTTILFDLSAGEVHATGTLAYSDTTATFTPSEPLNFSTFYTATVSAVVKDLAGNAMPGDYSWSFTTQ